MKNRLCYISRNYNNVNKARIDTERTLAEMGAVNLGLSQTFCKSKIVTFLMNLIGMVKMTLSLKSGDILFIQYPMKKYFRYVCRLAQRRKAKTVVLIHDLECMRKKQLSVEEELAKLIKADHIIATNDGMRQWLLCEGFWKPVGSMGLWDYRSDAVVRESPSAITRRIVYAGQLAMRKNSFLLEIEQEDLSYRMDIYGDFRRLRLQGNNPNISLHGKVASDYFLSHAEGDFGLVWDGDSLDWYSGDWGVYLRYNTPHKVSFYLRAGLPVLIHKNAALAPLIEQEGIGITISSIREIGKVLDGITSERMQAIRDNVRRVARHIDDGDYLRNAIQRALASASFRSFHP